MASKTLFVVPGTWEIQAGHAPNTPIGMMKNVTNLINPATFDVVYVNYPASFGPIANNGQPPLSQLGSPSYEQSVQMGVDEVIRLIGLMPAGRKFGVIGYSQGGAVAARVGVEAKTGGRLDSRKNEFLWLHTFGAPHRPQGKTFHLGNSLSGHGISGEPLGGFQSTAIPSTLDWFDYCLTNDIYGNAPVQSYCVGGYELVKDMTLTDPSGWAASIGTALTNGEIPEAVNDMNTNPLLFAQKSWNTGDAINRFGTSHTRYHLDNIVTGKTATAHSANHLNYWGTRR